MLRQHLDKEIQIIRDNLLLLNSMAETALTESVLALREHDSEKARMVQRNDAQINALRFELEGQIIVTIATQAPVLFDLRFLASSLNICTELERIGDYAKTIARISLMSEGIYTPRFLNSIYDMGFKTSEMLHRAMTAYIHNNSDEAVRIIADDDIIDAMYANLYSDLMLYVTTGAHPVQRVNQLLWAAHNLERAADRVTNICERVIYNETGELVDMAVSGPRPGN